MGFHPSSFFLKIVPVSKLKYIFWSVAFMWQPIEMKIILYNNNNNNIFWGHFFTLLWVLAFCSPWQSPPFHSILCIISHQTSNFHVSLNHFLPCHFWSFLPLPLLTVISISFFTQSFPSFLNTCHIHLSLLCLITSLIFSMPILSLSSAFVFFSLSDTPHIHLTILISALSSFCFLLSIHCSCFTSIYHWTSKHMPYRLSPFNLNAIFLLVKIPDNSLNFF